MKVSIIGSGYVGLVSGACFAELDHHVTCIDIDEKKISMLKDGKSPIYEPGLSDLITRNLKNSRLNFSTSFESVKDSACVFLAVGTPANEDGSADLKYIYSALEKISPYLQENSIVVIKSTVPIGTFEKVKNKLTTLTKNKIHVVNNPEFLKEGAAIDDFMKPDRVVIGHSSEIAAKVMEELYAPLLRQGNPIYMMSNLSAEMTKYAANSFLATKISFINEIAKLCDLTGADINEVRKGITSDKRIGNHFLYPGPGYGGSCFPKDVQALVQTGKEYKLDLKIVNAAEEVNQVQKTYIVEKIFKKFTNNLAGKLFTIWGVAFKPNTDDIRETSAFDIAKMIVSAGGKVNYYDPIAADNFEQMLKHNNLTATRVNDKYESLKNSDGLILVTEWSEFRSPDFSKINSQLNTKVIFDTRNVLDTKKCIEFKIEYYGIGRKG